MILLGQDSDLHRKPQDIEIPHVLDLLRKSNDLTPRQRCWKTEYSLGVTDFLNYCVNVGKNAQMKYF
jgi:hypothetical protein